jgi:ribonuclease D
MAAIVEEIIDSAEGLVRCCAYLATQPVIGMDTEFVGEETYHPNLCLVQVATPDRLILIDPFEAGPLGEFWKLLLDPARVVVVHAGREEVRLCRQGIGAVPANLFDLQIAAGLVGMTYPLGHGPLVNQLLGVRLSKAETLTEWRRRPLTDDQIRYAYDDVRYLLPCYAKIAGRLEKQGRSDWAREEFGRLCNAASPEDPALEERWRRLKGIGSLDRRKLAVVRALYEWREGRAAELNRPARTIVRDDLLVEIARRSPTKARDLQVVRGLQTRDLDAIVAIVLEAKELPVEHHPAAFDREQDPPQLATIAGVVIAVFTDLCTRRQLAPNLVASNNDLRILVRARLAGEALPDDIPLTGGWRAAHILPEVQAVLEGRRSVRIADLQAETPLATSEVPGPM